MLLSRGMAAPSFLQGEGTPIPESRAGRPAGPARAPVAVAAGRPATYMEILPAQMSAYMRQSPMKLQSGRLNEAGRFFSKP